MNLYSESTARPTCGYCGMPTTSLLNPYLCEACRNGRGHIPQPKTQEPASITARCVVCAWRSIHLLHGEGLGDRIGITCRIKADARDHSNATGHDVTVLRIGGSEAGLIESIGRFCPVCRTPQARSGEWCEACLFHRVI